ncbi:MAG: hypothetical protein Q8R28_21770, partial [Dehalococcoidia bacterium]|nr:hypothetical protein [Dehalococcoidia bacterium]
SAAATSLGKESVVKARDFLVILKEEFLSAIENAERELNAVKYDAQQDIAPHPFAVLSLPGKCEIVNGYANRYARAKWAEEHGGEIT